MEGPEWSFTNLDLALAGWLSWLEHLPIHQNFADSVPGQGTYLGCGFDPQLRCEKEATNWYFSLSLSKINKHILR